MPKLNMRWGAGPRAVTRGLLFFSLGLVLARPGHARVTIETTTCAEELAPSHIVTVSDEEKFKAFSDQHHLTIELLAPAPGALAYRKQLGYRAKPEELKNCRSLKSGPNKGLVACPPELFANHAAWYEEMQNLAQQGFYVIGGKEYLVSDAKGALFFSDYDLLGVWDAAGNNAYDETMRYELNQMLGRDLVMHGPLAIYEHRARVGLKLLVRLFTPNEKPVTAMTIPDLRAKEKERHIRWVW